MDHSCACGKPHETDWKPPAYHLHFSHGPFCSITGNQCGTDTWDLANPPNCWCGRLIRENDRLRNPDSANEAQK